MDYKIIIDSCSDITPEMEEKFNIVTVPLHLRLGQKEYMDDANLNIAAFMEEMQACKEKVGTAAVTPAAFSNAMTQDAFVVTVSAALSATYSNAIIAAEDVPADVHVFDSKSASAGGTLVALKIRELVARGLPKTQIIESVNNFIDNMKTYLVLERFENLIKNGRLGALKGKLASVLNVKLLLGADGHGEISLHAKVRGTKAMLEKMLSLISASGRKTAGENAVISHCNNQTLAEQLAGLIRQRFDFKEIFVIPTRGTSSLYADDKGIILAF
ncbi:MAG: DegV family protein [Clostridiales bacterium]|jgi:DegV family protein with EDD domain|nr:DegV family protein [Clostridiales bacterium]